LGTSAWLTTTVRGAEPSVTVTSTGQAAMTAVAKAPASAAQEVMGLFAMRGVVDLRFMVSPVVRCSVCYWETTMPQVNGLPPAAIRPATTGRRAL
jgi:hypothetical protein